jgi:TatD DNase family protein
MPLFDTHAHLDNEQLSADPQSVLHRARAAGVEALTAIGTDLATSQKCVALAKEFDGVYAAVGVHPTHCHKDEVADCWDKITSLSREQAVVAIGETGLDLHWDQTTLDVQKVWFQRHIDLSFETGKPLVIHMRDCEQEIVSMLEASAIDGAINGVMHSFTGSLETAKRCLSLGMYISFAGMVTFKKSGELRSVAAEIPDDRILIETDAPYLSPHPLRSKRPNEPAYLVHTAACLADVRDISPEELGRITTENANRVFRIR